MSECKQLSGGTGVVSDSSIPAVYERTVIREALYRMQALELVDAGEQAFGPSVSIPYSYRDPTAASRLDTRSYEGQGIQRAGVIQTSETAYPIPQKLAFLVSDELRYMASASTIQWDAVRENANNAARIVAEDTDRLLLNSMLRASDEYTAVAVANENIAAAFDSAKTIFPLAHFPVVRPHAIYDLQASQVGNATNPVTVTYDSIARSEYDGTGTQAAGIYYVVNYNLGEILFVDESGAEIAPANGVGCTVSYSYATNVYAFNTDLGTALAEDHWNNFLYRYGLRKAAIEDDRYYMANFGLMSGTPPPTRSSRPKNSAQISNSRARTSAPMAVSAGSRISPTTRQPARAWIMEISGYSLVRKGLPAIAC